jgi:hypothetical protein
MEASHGRKIRGYPEVVAKNFTIVVAGDNLILDYRLVGGTPIRRSEIQENPV